MKKERPYFYNNDIIFPTKPIKYIVALPSEKLILVKDKEEILPGIKAFWVGGHTLGCMAV